MIDLSRAKSNLHHIIEVLPERETLAAEMFLKFLVSQIDDPVLATLLTAEEDTEPLSEEEIAESEANWQAYLQGDKGEPWEKAREELANE